MAPRWRKVWRDLALDWPRTALAVMALALGTFGVGSDLAARAILEREIARSFDATRPPSLVLHLGGAGADRALARAAAALPGVEAAEARGELEARMQAGPDRWRRLMVHVVDDFQALEVSVFRAGAGAAVPPTGALLLERSSAPFLQRTLGETLALRTPEGPLVELAVAGLVHDGALSPGWVDGRGDVYLGVGTFALLGEPGPALGQLRLRLRPGADPGAVAEAARRVAEARGLPVTGVDDRLAPRHPHHDQMASLLFMFGAFGALSLLLGGVLAAAVVATLLRRQLRQLGVMKALGASTGQLAAMSLAGVLLLAGAALAVSVPAALLGARAYATFVGQVLNLDVASLAIPAWVPLVQAAAGLGVPLLAAALPVWKVSRVPALEALRDGGGPGPGAGGAGWLARPTWLDRPTWLALQNLLRTRGRLALTVGMLAVGGATFLAALGVSASWRNTVDGLFAARRYQLQVVFSRPLPAAAVVAALAPVEGVSAVETWASALATVDRPGPPVQFTLTGLPADTAMVAYPVLEGRWLRPGDTGAVVLNHELAQDPDAALPVGARVTLEVAGRRAPFTVVGVVKELGMRRRGRNLPAAAYVTREALEALTAPGLAASAVLAAPAGGPAALDALTVRVEQALDRAGLPRTVVQASTDRRRELLDHLVVIRDFLLAMAALVAAVGGLALGAARSLDVLERRRELGVMRALGASPRQLLRLVLAEGAAVAVGSWLLALVLAHPLTALIGDVAGRIFVHAPLELEASLPGVAGWLVLAVAVSAAAAGLPLWRALARPVAEALRSE